MGEDGVEATGKEIEWETIKRIENRLREP